MATNFYIQPVGGSQIDIEAVYGLRVTSVRGLELGDPKEIFKRDWIAENGVDVYVPETRGRKATEVTMTCFIEDGTTTAKAKYDTFIAYLTAGGTGAEFDYWDTLQKSKVRCIFEGKKSTWYQFVGKKQIMCEITMFNPSGNKTDV
jgi:hypothetical protein